MLIGPNSKNVVPNGMDEWDARKVINEVGRIFMNMEGFKEIKIEIGRTFLDNRGGIKVEIVIIVPAMSRNRFFDTHIFNIILVLF